MEMKDFLLANLGKNGHVDTLPIARKFYALFWGECLTNKPDDYKGEIDSKYTGETIISFNTIAGCTIRLLPAYRNGDILMSKLKNQEQRLEIILNADEEDISQEIKKNFNEFFTLYHSLANLMPFPFRRGKVNSLNYKKGQMPYRDFPDKFLIDIKNDCYTGIQNTFKKDSLKIFVKWSGDYFEKFPCWKDYVEMNYLQPFFKNPEERNYDVDEQIKLSPTEEIDEIMPWSEDKSCYLCKSDESAENIKKCKEYIKCFLCKSIKIIKNRARLLSDAL